MATTIRENTTIDEVYTLRQRLGEGGMSIVYLADVDLDRFDYRLLYAFTQVQGESQGERRRKAEAFCQEVARDALDPGTVRTILKAHKIPLPESTVAVKVAKDDVDAERFEAEWRNLLCLNHPYVIKVYGGGRWGERPYYAMEVLANVVPPDRIAEDFTLRQKLEIVIQAGKGLGYLHRNGIVHRDVKPDNMVTCETASGAFETKITDLGIAKNLDASLALTMTRTVLGTPYFMSPEQVESAKHVDARADIYSLGASLYQLLTGKPPYHDKTSVYEIVHALTSGEPPIGPEEHNPLLPDPVHGMIACAMARNPDYRYQSMDELVQDLTAYVWAESSDLMATTIEVADTAPADLDAPEGGGYIYARRQAAERAAGRTVWGTLAIQRLIFTARAASRSLAGTWSALLGKGSKAPEGTPAAPARLPRKALLTGVGVAVLGIVALVAFLGSGESDPLEQTDGPEAPAAAGPDSPKAPPPPAATPELATVDAETIERTTRPAATGPDEDEAPGPAPVPAPSPEEQRAAAFRKSLAAAQEHLADGSDAALAEALVHASQALRTAETDAEEVRARALVERAQEAKKQRAVQKEYSQWLSRGRQALQKRDWREAIRAFGLAIKLQKTDAAQSLLAQAETGKAREEAEHAYTRLLETGTQALARDRCKEAIAAYQGAAKLKDTPEVRRLLGEARKRQAQLAREREQREAYAAWIDKGKKALEEEAFDQALDAFARAEQVRQTQEVGKLKELTHTRKKLWEARQATARAQAAETKQPHVKPEERKSIAEANRVFDQAEHEREVGIRSLFRKRSQYMTAARLYQKVIDTWPQSDKVEACHYWRGVIFQTLMEYDKAVPEYKRVLAINPRTPRKDVYFRLAQILDKQLKQYPQARKYYEQAAAKGQHGKFRAEAEARAKELAEAGY